MEKKRRRRKEEEEREPWLPGDKGEEATGHTKQLGTFGTPRCEHRQPQQLNQKEIIFWLNTFILQQKLKIKTTVAFSEDPPSQRKSLSGLFLTFKHGTSKKQNLRSLL